jgi:MFS family permease
MTTQPFVTADPTYSRRWLILAVVGVAQVMVLLDATVVNIALPSAQRALHSSNGDRQWVVTAYALAFGSLLAGRADRRSVRP